MPKVKVYDLNAKECGTVTLKDEVFGCEYNEPLIHEVVVAYLANQRQEIAAQRKQKAKEQAEYKMHNKEIAAIQDIQNSKIVVQNLQ